MKYGLIELSMSEWATPVLFVPKKDGRIHFCIDYRKMNSMTVNSTYPLLRMDECIDSLVEAHYFSMLVTNSCYRQINIPKQDRQKTAFVCHAGTFQYIKMPFGLSNAPATFQRALDNILTNYIWKTRAIYVDDVIIFSKNVIEHIRHVYEVLSIPCAA